MELKLEIANRASEYEPTRDRLIEHFREAGLSEDAIADLELILEELLVNIISYAYDEEGAGTICVTASVEASTVTLILRDSGRPFDPLGNDEPDLDASVEDRPIGGLGIFLVSALATSVAYARVEGFNVLTVVKDTGTGPGPADSA